MALKCGQNWFHGGRARQAPYDPLLPGSWITAYGIAAMQAAAAAITDVDAHWKDKCPATPVRDPCSNKHGLVSYTMSGKQIRTARGRNACEVRVSWIVVISCSTEKRKEELTVIDWEQMEDLAPDEHIEKIIEAKIWEKEKVKESKTRP